jgi:hypothetical protein
MPIEREPPPENSWTLAGQIEYYLWLATRTHQGEHWQRLWALLEELMSRPPLVATIAWPPKDDNGKFKEEEQ